MADRKICKYLTLFLFLGMLSNTGVTLASERVMNILASPGAWAGRDGNGEPLPSGGPPGRVPRNLLTEAALSQLDSFDFRVDDPMIGCGPPGMPRALTHQSPMEFKWLSPHSEQRYDLLIIEYETGDITRLVYMDRPDAPPATPITPDGFARGHWEGETLVIETSHMDTRIQDLGGTPKSPDFTLEERYSIEEVDGDTILHVTLTMNDPLYLTGPFSQDLSFILMPDWEVALYNCVERPVELMPASVSENGLAPF